jgi:hypothetical protein
MSHRNNGPALPRFIAQAGRPATESYMDFFDRQSLGCASNYRSISRRFFGWADEQNLTLDSLRGEHVSRFHQHLWEDSGPNMAYASFSVMKRLLAHMHEKGGLSVNPAAGIQSKTHIPFKKVQNDFCARWGEEATEEVTQAAMVMIAPVCIRTFSLKAIRAWSQYPFSVVEKTAGTLLAKGIWVKDEDSLGIRCEWLDPECVDPEYAILLDAWVVIGIFERDENLKYRLPPQRYERLKAEQSTGAGRVEITRTVREERREVVVVREASDKIVQS